MTADPKTAPKPAEPLASPFVPEDHTDDFVWLWVTPDAADGPDWYLATTFAANSWDDANPGYRVRLIFPGVSADDDSIEIDADEAAGLPCIPLPSAPVDPGEGMTHMLTLQAGTMTLTWQWDARRGEAAEAFRDSVLRVIGGALDGSRP